MAQYYRIALVAQVEPHEENGAWRCYEDLKLGGHAVEVLDPALYPDLLGSDGAVNMDALATFVSVFKPDYVAKAGERAEDILADLRARGVPGADNPARHFVIYGYVGKDNFGDELIFHTLHTHLAERYPGSYVTLIGHGPARALERHGVAAIRPSAGVKADYLLNGASALLFMAGLMFDTGFARNGAGHAELFLSQRDITILAALTQLAYLNNVPVVYAGIGAGPLGTTEAQRHIQLASLTKPLYITRDATTTDFLLRAGVDASLISEKADLAFLTRKPEVSAGASLRFGEHDLNAGEYVFVSLRDCDNLAPTMTAAVAAALDAAFEECGLCALFADFAPEDRAIHDEVVSLMRNPEAAVFFGDTKDFGRVFEAIAASRMVVAMRLHASILANAFDVPSIGLDYNDKIAAFYQKMGQDALVFPLSCGQAELVEAVRAVQSDYAGLKRAVSEKAEISRVLAAQAMDKLCAAVDARTPAPRRQRLCKNVCSRETILLQRSKEKERAARLKSESLSKELEQVRKERDEALRELEKLKGSTSWKAGRALTSIPRALKGDRKQ